ncbi:MAG: 4Fe-4S dicluster domain-containing protein [Acidimicrobiia bacterium]|nr:4Fe-4S dicluster domain-containing protein [Acidimicrobiia bacterium]
MSVTATIDGRQVTVPGGTTILMAMRSVELDVPTLCFGPTLEAANVCRVCMVEVEGVGTLVPSCSRELLEGMVVSTTSERAVRGRRVTLELLASASELDRTERMEEWLDEHEADPARFAGIGVHDEAPKIQDDLYVRDYARCILCYRCVDACGDQHQNTFAITVAGRGFDAHISTEFDVALPDSACVYCGNCIAVCPTGALEGKLAWDLKEAGAWAPDRQEVTRTVCSYCGVGCNLDVTTQDGSIVDVASPMDHDVTAGNLCIKGRFGWSFVVARDD